MSADRENDDPLMAPAGKGPEIAAPKGGAEVGPATDSGGELTTPAPAGARSEPQESRNMLPPRERRRSRAERLLVRLIATGGIVGIGVAIGAIMVSSKSQGWLIGLVVSVVSVVLAAILWSSRQL